MLLIKLLSFISLIIADTSRIIIASMTDRNLHDFIYICMVLTTLHISKRVNHNRTLNHNHTMNHNRMVITIVRNRSKSRRQRFERSIEVFKPKIQNEILNVTTL